MLLICLSSNATMDVAYVDAIVFSVTNDIATNHHVCVYACVILSINETVK